MTALSAGAVDLLAAVERGDLVRMPGGRTWDVNRGVFRNRGHMDPLCYAELVTVERVESSQMDRTYLLTDEGRAALSAARATTPTTEEPK